MTVENKERVERAPTVTYPVASFTLAASQIEWIAEQAKKHRKKKSQFLRDVLDKVIQESKEQAA